MTRKAKQTITAETWTRFGLPRPEVEVRVCEDRMWRVDFLWECGCAIGCVDRPPVRLSVEVHGGTWVGGGHSRGVRQASDFAKGHRCTLNGWHRMEFTPRQVTSGYAPAVVKAWLMGDRAPELPPDPDDRRKGRVRNAQSAAVGACKGPSRGETGSAHTRGRGRGRKGLEGASAGEGDLPNQ